MGRFKAKRMVRFQIYDDDFNRRNIHAVSLLPSAYKQTRVYRRIHEQWVLKLMRAFYNAVARNF